MRIAFLTFSALPHMGGYQIFTYNLMQRMAEMGHEVHYYIPHCMYKEFKELPIKKNFKVHPIFRHELRFAKYAPIILRIIIFLKHLIRKYHLWQVIGSYPAGYITINLVKHVPVVLRTHGDDIQKVAELNYGNRLNPGFEKKILKSVTSATHLVALTPSVTKIYKEFGISDDKISEIPNAIDLSRFQKSINTSKIRDKFHIKKNDIFIVTVGRYHIKKGYEYIPEAARILKNKGYPIKWVLIGKNTKNILDSVKKHNIEDVIYFHESVRIQEKNNSIVLIPTDDIINLYKSADIFAFPSLLETFGMVLIEAMAAGLPVVTTDVPGCRDVVVHKHNGMLAHSKNAMSLAKNIEELIKNSNLKNRIIKNIASEITQYDWKIVSNKYEVLYKKLVNRK